MIEHFKFRNKTRNLNNARSRMAEKFRILIIASKNKDERQVIEEEAYFEDKMARAEINVLRSKYWLNKARYYDLPFPPSENIYWEDYQDQYYSGRHLSTQGVVWVKNAVREELSQARKAILEWSGVVIGIIGALTGMLAVFLSGK